MRVTSSSRRLFGGVLLGILLLQLAWVLAVPAFRGSDEFDHAIKADATARGQLTGSEPATDGRGELMRVRADVARALGPMCDSYRYTGPDNCHPVRTFDDGTVEIASAASAYDPVYYVVAGVAALPFPGAGSLFTMRAVTAVLSALLVAWATVVTRRWAVGDWPGLALLVSSTPVVLYSTTVAAPNGVGMAGGILLWAAAAGLVTGRGRAPWPALSVGAVAVAVTHTTGLLWVPLVLMSVVLLRPWGWWRERLRERRPAVLTSGVVVAVAFALAAGWVFFARTNALAPQQDLPPLRPGDLAFQVIAWVLQTVAAFPVRNEYAPLAVYPMWLLAFGALLVLGFRAAPARTRAVLVLLVSLWIGVAVMLTVVSYASEPFAWQGRYAIPLAVGLSTVAGVALSSRGVRPRGPVAVAVLLLTAIAHVVCVAHVAVREADLRLSPSFADIVPGPPLAVGLVVGLLAAAGLAVAVLAWRASCETVPSTQAASG